MSETSIPKWTRERVIQLREELQREVHKIELLIGDYMGSHTEDRWSQIEHRLLVALREARVIRDGIKEIDREYCLACGALLPRPNAPWWQTRDHVHGVAADD